MVDAGGDTFEVLLLMTPTEVFVEEIPGRTVACDIVFCGVTVGLSVAVVVFVVGFNGGFIVDFVCVVGPVVGFVVMGGVVDGVFVVLDDAALDALRTVVVVITVETVVTLMFCVTVPITE